MKRILVFILLIAIATAVTNYFSFEGEVDVTESKLSVSPKSFIIEIPKGGSYTKKITVENSGNEVKIYFEKIVEGPTPDAISVYFHDVYGNSITSTKKLRIPAGSEAYPAKTVVNVHIDVSKNADSGTYRIYVQAKG